MFQAGSFPVAKRLVNLGYKVPFLEQALCSASPSRIATKESVPAICA